MAKESILMEMETFIKDNGMKAKDKAKVFISTKKTADSKFSSFFILSASKLSLCF